mmetsp:Transcript_60307/g.111866  ORF Transcript_60307/g.111866 Transcript_60307/m.111866 type:complete len:297 (-) Transcript_60307:52-942(-)
MNDYILYDEIGNGKYSVVYKGRKRHTITYVAIKSTEKSRRNRVMNEVNMASQLKHDNIVRFHQWHETRNHLWIISEYCAGGDLLRILKQDGRLPEGQVRNFGREIIAGLNHVHSHGIVHCDLKPANLQCDEAGTIKLAGFGQARWATDVDRPVDAGPVQQGTPQYMAPELFQDCAAYSAASDLWALGCVLHEMLAGRSPFHGPSMQELQQAVVEDRAPPMPNAPAELQALVDGLLEKDPRNRMPWHRLISHSFWGLSGGTAQDYTSARGPRAGAPQHHGEERRRTSRWKTAPLGTT